ncbi:MAG: MBG domain-containing protein [Dysgonomonas sp.]
MKGLIADDDTTPIDDFVIDPISDFVYIGQPINPSITITDQTGTVLTQNTDYTVSYNNDISVGVAEVVATGKNSYTGTISAKFNITPATLSIKANAISMIYGTDPSSLNLTKSYTIDGLVNGETESNLTLLPQVIINSTMTSHTAIGTYSGKVMISGAKAENYNFIYINNTLTILKNSQGNHLVLDNIPQKTYGNNPFILNGYHSLGKPVTFESDDPNIISVAYNGQNWIATVHNAGSTIIRIKFAGDDDCEAEEKVQQVIVDKAPLSIVVLDQSRGEMQQNFDVSNNYCISGYVNASDASSFISYPSAKINPYYNNYLSGTYPGGVLAEGGNHPNYYMDYHYGTLTIEPITREIHFAPFCDKMYGDSPFILLATHSTGLTVKYESLNPDIISVAEYSGVWKATIHHVGTATIRAYIEGGSNPNVSEKFQTITVVRAPMVIRPDNRSKYYGDENPSLSVSFFGLKYNDTSDDFGNNIKINTNATVTSDAGTYAITASGAHNDNYNISYNPGYLTINKAIVAISLDDDNSVYTGQALHTNPATISGIIGNVSLPISYSYKKGNNISSYAVNAGTYEVTATTIGDKNHASTFTKASFDVDKVIPVINLTAVSTDYTGNPIPVNAPVITGSTTSQGLPYDVKYKGIGETVYPEAANAPIDYGTYEATVSTQGDENHYPASSKTTISIGKGTPVMSMIGKTKIYDGIPLSMTATIIPPSLKVTYTYQGTLKDGTRYESTPQAPVNAGNYTVTAYTGGDGNHIPTSVTVEIEITKKEANIAMSNKSTPYTGEPISIEKAITEPIAAPLVITYKGVGKTDYPESQQAPTNGGTYQVKATFAGDNNYLPKQTTASLIITDAGIPELTLDSKSVVYNGNTQNIGEARISPSIAEYLKITYFYESINYPASDTPPTNAAIYMVTATTPADENFKAGIVTATLTIEKAPLILSLNDYTAVYTGQSLQTLPAVITGIIGDETFPISYAYSRGYKRSMHAIEAGIYTVTASTLGDENHAGTSTSASFIVDKATPIISLTSISTDYTGDPIPVNAPVITGSTTSQNLLYDVKYKGIGETDYPETTNAPIDYGTYEATVSTQGDENHYPASSKTTISIGKGTPVMSMIGKTKIYDGTPLSITASIAPPDLEITYSYKGTLYNPTDKAPINAGNYTVTASTVGNHNYAAASVTADIEITRKAASIVMNNKSTSYTGESIAIETPITEPSTASLLVTYAGTGKTDYPESQQAPKNGGTYLVKAIFAGNNNYLPTQATANLTITDAGTPTLMLDNKTVVYNGSKQAIGEANISPAIAEYLTITYTYTNADYPTSTTPPTNAGVYTVTATTAADSNFKAGSVTAILTIEKANQTITFPELGTKSISEGSINTGATVNTGLTLIFSSGNTEIAEVDTNGSIAFKKAGTVTITASQEGNENYNSITLSRTLNITSNDATLYGLRINGVRINISDNMYYDLNCSEIKEFDIVLETEANATVNTGKSFTVTIDKPMLKVIESIITSQDGQVTKTYKLTIEKRFKFDDIVKTRWNNTMTVINNPDNNGGYRFTSFKWFRNGQEIASGQSYSAGSLYETLDPADKYYVEITGEQFDGTLRSCEGSPKLRSQTVKAYPNPALLSETVFVEADVDEELLEGAVIDVYSVSGLKIMQLKAEGKYTPVKLSNASTYIFKFRGKDGFSKDLRVIVK